MVLSYLQYSKAQEGLEPDHIPSGDVVVLHYATEARFYSTLTQLLRYVAVNTQQLTGLSWTAQTGIETS